MRISRVNFEKAAFISWFVSGLHNVCTALLIFANLINVLCCVKYEARKTLNGIHTSRLLTFCFQEKHLPCVELEPTRPVVGALSIYRTLTGKRFKF